MMLALVRCCSTTMNIIAEKALAAAVCARYT
jgi:hypothetical protein